VSHSRKKTPIIPVTKMDSDAEWKRWANRSLRRLVRTLLHMGKEECLLVIEEVSESWTWNKDAKRHQQSGWFRKMFADDPDEFKRYLRK
jgi:hypothetical protein